MRKSEKRAQKKPSLPDFQFFVVTCEVICQKMAPILDPVIFFGVFTLLDRSGVACLEHLRVFPFLAVKLLKRSIKNNWRKEILSTLWEKYWVAAWGKTDIGQRWDLGKPGILLQEENWNKTDTNDKKKALWKSCLIELFQLLIPFFSDKRAG